MWEGISTVIKVLPEHQIIQKCQHSQINTSSYMESVLIVGGLFTDMCENLCLQNILPLYPSKCWLLNMLFITVYQLFTDIYPL